MYISKFKTREIKNHREQSSLRKPRTFNTAKLKPFTVFRQVIDQGEKSNGPITLPWGTPGTSSTLTLCHAIVDLVECVQGSLICNFVKRRSRAD